MANPSTVHEPSMEEILASIRQIISEDGGSSAPKIDGVVREPGREIRGYAAEEPTQAEAAPAFEIEGREREGAPELEPVYQAAYEETVEESESDYAPEPLHRSMIAPRATRDEDEEPLLSPRSGEAISGAFGALAHTLLAQNARTLEDVVTEMLQPMLRQWLDDNLPGIVERKVQEEIERVARGRR